MNSSFNLIGDLLARDLTQNIEEIIKVDQTDEQVVHAELTEYIATEGIKDEFQKLFLAIAEALSDPSEGIGIWISGFFGSGKSSFAKNLGYILQNPELQGEQASSLLKKRLERQRLQELVDFINQRIPAKVIMFDVMKEGDVKYASGKIAEVMYTVLLRELGYAEDYDIADLEIELEREGKLEEFIDRCQQQFNKEWRIIRKGAQKVSRASAILHSIDPETYPAADSWAKSLREKRADITVSRFVERAFDLCSRRCPGQALVFIIDEAGGYVARSADKIEDLRAVVEEFGRVGRNLVKKDQITSPAWIVITSQEKLDEVVAAIDDKRVDLPRLQDRFKYQINMAPADIREVATKRILAKKNDAAEALLVDLFQESEGSLNVACKLERSTRNHEIDREDFVQFYPYLPHYIDISIDIVSGIRLQPGAARHVGGSNRTIIKQAYEMLTGDRTALAKEAIGALVTLDKVYALVEGNLSTEKRSDITEITRRFQDDPTDQGMTARVAKTVCLLEFVRDLPRTPANIAAFLVDRVGNPAPKLQVEQAIQKLYDAQFIRNTEEGWKLQTAQEKNWETERRSIAAKQRDKNAIIRDTMADIFSAPALKTYKPSSLRTFKTEIQVEGNRVGDEGQIPISIAIAADAQEYQTKLSEVRNESRQENHKNDVYWVLCLNPDIDDLITNAHQSKQMVGKYSQMQAQGKITPQEAICLKDEEREVSRFQARLKEKLSETIQAGSGMFRGVEKSGADLGKNLGEIFKGLLDTVVPDLYPKLEMGARPLKGTEAEEVLKAANLNALSEVFYDGPQGLGLVIKEGAKYVPNAQADIAREVLSFLQAKHAYGEKITGKEIDQHFQGIGYGWERDMLRLVLAVLLRAGAIEVTYQGRRFRNHMDAQCRVPFINNTAFKSASFAPYESVDLKTLIAAVQALEELTGEEVDVEEGAIALALKKLAEEELKLLIPIEAIARANHLPITSFLEDYHQTLAGIQSAASDDCVRTLAGEGESLESSRNRLHQIHAALTENGLDTIRQARQTATMVWPALMGRPEGEEVKDAAEKLQANLTSPDIDQRLPHLQSLTETITAVFETAYTQLHNQRHEGYAKAIDVIRNRPEWESLPEGMGDALLLPLTSRACQKSAELRNTGICCQACSATLSQMESDLAALQGLKVQVLARLQELTTSTDQKQTRVERVRVSEFFTGVLDDDKAINSAVERFREHLLKLVDEGARIIVE